MSKVIHQASIDLNEEGTETSAATAVKIMLRSMLIGEKKFKFKCNRPFIFVIHETRSNGILFIGKYVKPWNIQKYSINFN